MNLQVKDSSEVRHGIIQTTTIIMLCIYIGLLKLVDLKSTMQRTSHIERRHSDRQAVSTLHHGVLLHEAVKGSGSGEATGKNSDSRSLQEPFPIAGAFPCRRLRQWDIALL